MKRSIVFFAVVSLLYATGSVLGQSQSEKDRAAFISNTRLLEKVPFNPNAAGAREWGFKWLVETDQVTVAICGGTMELIPEKKNKFKAELLMQHTFGMGVFKLENPDKKSDEKSAQMAGFESMLRAYEVMVNENEKARNSNLDSLLAKQKAGELKAVVDAAFDKGKCGSSNSK
ncbi:MAG: hypothetical protein QUS14_12895 [Pyrinomonadaceae bacterium]|nr:hypothetical protein [Pyrinomonadaceae bacterium]